MSIHSEPVSTTLQLLPLERPGSVRKHFPELSSGWLLDHYVVGPENQQLVRLFSHDSIKNLVSVSPILFYGEKSLGKTALAISLAVQWSRFHKERPVCFLRGSDFCQQFASAVEIDDIGTFRSKTRSCKMLVIDGIEPLADKPAAQTELSSALDVLGSLNRPAILTSNVLPATSCGFLPHFSSRCLSGYSIQLLKPQDATRAKLLTLLCEKTNPKLPVADLISLADDLCSDQPLTLPQLSNMVLLANQNIQPSGELDLFVLRSLMLQLLVDQSPDISLIARLVCRRMMVKLSAVRGDSRVSSMVRARGLSMLLARRFTTLSLQQIGLYFSGRDHSTVLNAIRRSRLALADDPELAACYRDVEAELLGR